MRGRKKTGLMLSAAFLFALVFLAWAGVRTVSYIQYDRNLGGYLKRAADANTVELASRNLAVALKYIEANGLTSGYTSVLWRTPDEDVGFWYENLKASFKELNGIKPETTQLERTNILMKLRETLLDQGDKGMHVTAPDGISIFPNNVIYALWFVFSLMLTVLTFIFAVADPDF